MGSLSSVFRSWKRHVTSEVHRQPSMQWSNGGAAVLATTNFYIVGDLAGATSCYVTAHGGLSDGDYYFDNTAFRVPAGVTINFYQPHGYTLGFHTGALRNAAPIGHGGTDDQSYAGGADCPNYMLTKDQGMHAAGDMDTARRFDMTYAAMQEIVEEQGIVIVSVRNRWFHAGVTLKSAVSEVTSAAPGLTTFNCLFCRVTDDSGDDRWNAVGGMWDKD